MMMMMMMMTWKKAADSVHAKAAPAHTVFSLFSAHSYPRLLFFLRSRLIHDSDSLEEIRRKCTGDSALSSPRLMQQTALSRHFGHYSVTY